MRFNLGTLDSGERSLPFGLLVFVCFVRVSFCHLSLPLGIGGWLRFIIVTFPGLFYQLSWSLCLDQRFEIGQCYSVKHSLQFLTLLSICKEYVSSTTKMC